MFFTPLRRVTAVAIAVAGATSAALFSTSANAVPSMGRQTGMPCAACHTVYPELTPFGRQFKLRGYAMGQIEAKNSPVGNLPISALLQGSRTQTRTTLSPGADPTLFDNDREWLIQGAGLYYGGKITEKSGALVQYFYDGFEKKWLMEMVDIRYADTARWAGRDVVYGFTLSNSPTVTDLYNSTPQWSYPHTETAAIGPNANPLINLGLASKVAGPGAYFMLNDWLYAEVALYRNTKRGAFRPLGWGEEKDPLVDGIAPYWRLALQHQLGNQSFSAGLFGLSGRTFPEGEQSGNTDRFRDIGLDAQYQLMAGAHILTFQGNVIRERLRLTESFRAGQVSTEQASLRTANLGAHYYFDRTYGLRLKVFRQSGSLDDLRFNTGEAVTGSVNGSPNNRGWSGELLYLPLPQLQLSLRYTAYSQFNGSGTNYDGFGRDASDNNSLFLLAWWLF
jgi:hypothetical protein